MAAGGKSLSPAAPGPRKRRPGRTPAPEEAARFGYEAVQSRGRRAAPSRPPRAEKIELSEGNRTRLYASALDAVRNNPIVAWAVRRYVSAVAQARLQVNATGGLKRLLERLFAWHAAPRNFDLAGRMGREETFLRFETERFLAGDAALILLADGRVQRIESDLIAKPRVGAPDGKGGYSRIPPEIERTVDKQGLVMAEDFSGRVEAFCICNRGHDGRQIAFDHLEPAENVIFSAYWGRFSSQGRGISPLAPALNSAKDLAETLEWQRLKTKMHALFGLALMRDDLAHAATPAEAAAAWGDASGVGTAAPDDGAGSIKTHLQDLSPDTMLLLDMAQGDKIDTIESKTPSAEFREFVETIIRQVLCALDIPYVFYNTSGASFSGIKAAANDFERAVEPVRRKNRWARKAYSDWLILRAWNNPDWNLRVEAEKQGIRNPRIVQEACEWVSTGTPWLEKLQEVEGDIKAVAAGYDNPIDICRRRGSDYYQNIEKTALAYEAAARAGVPIILGDPGATSVREKQAAEEAEETRTP